MSKKIFLFFIFYFLFAGSYCSAARWFEPPGPSLQEYITYSFNMATTLAGILAVIVLIFSGIQFIYSAGNPEKTSEAKKRAISAVLGLFILLSSFLIIQTINPKLKNLDPTEQLKMIGPFRFIGGTDGASTGKHSGCGISECLGTNGSCSNDNCGGFDYTGCQEGECLDSNGTSGSCSSLNCISSLSGCPIYQCLGTDGSCSFQNCNWIVDKLAPMSLENMDEINKGYSRIVWRDQGKDLVENSISYCDPINRNLVYNLYLYKNYNFKNLLNVLRLRCDNWHRPLGIAKSYILVKETPGVYFYGNENCYPKGDTPPAAITESIPEGWNDEVKSVRIVNGPNSIKGPFFGLIYFNGSDYKTNQANPWAMEIQQKKWKWPDFEALDNYSYCFPVGNNVKNGSWVIYQWVGYEEDGKTFASAGDGVTLHSKTGWLGGYNQLGGKFSRLSANLKNTPVFYSSNSNVPAEEQKLCSYFYPDKSCLKSFEIKGDYLVIVSSDLFRGNNNPHQPDIFNAHAQTFPISPRLQEVYKDREGYSVEQGTPELTLDYIGWLKQARYIEVVPLAGKSN